MITIFQKYLAENRFKVVDNLNKSQKFTKRTLKNVLSNVQ